MSDRLLRIVSPGIQATVQDLGRFNYQRYGMPVGGAMDSLALRMGNILAGNPQNSPAIESTFAGLEVEFNQPTLIALSGAPCSIQLGHTTLEVRDRSVLVPAGTLLRVAAVHSGCRVYLCVAGGITVRPVMGSSSTYLRAGVGGYCGRALVAGDLLPIGNAPALAKPRGSSREATSAGRIVPPTISSEWYRHDLPVRVVLGPHHHRFSRGALERFISSDYTVGLNSDRMGYRLEGPVLPHRHGADIISDTIAAGAVQVPGNGLPVIMMADRQTTGGYTKIAHVISADLPKLAQMAPGNTLRFEPVELHRAHELLRRLEWHISFVERMYQSPQDDHLEVQVSDQLYYMSIRSLPASSDPEIPPQRS